MEPLSITTGIVTLIGAAHVITKGLVKLKDYRDAPTEIAMLINEVCLISVSKRKQIKKIKTT